MRVSLKTTNSTTGAKVQKSAELLTVGKVRVAIGIGISASGKWLIVAGGNKIYVAAISNLKSGFTKFVCPEKLTCLALHPAEDWLATGDETGQIRLWYCLKDDLSFEKAGEDKTAPTTTLHWHAHALQAIEFTPNGAYLLSGGEESVLVIWQLHTGKKEFVPRVGAPIHTISVCDTGDGVREQEYLLGLGDGSLAFVRSSTLKLARTIARLRLGMHAQQLRQQT
jgi:NET1-associated nuclear protein 1 (U3 small nucleolar RNA-associated protein 17)